MKNMGSFTQVFRRNFTETSNWSGTLQDGLVKAGEVISTFRESRNMEMSFWKELWAPRQSADDPQFDVLRIIKT
jgi:hypothetical protein